MEFHLVLELIHPAVFREKPIIVGFGQTNNSEENVLSQNLVKKSYLLATFFDGEFIKACLFDVCECLFSK